MKSCYHETAIMAAENGTIAVCLDNKMADSRLYMTGLDILNV